MYPLDTGVFYTLGNYFPSRFPSLWTAIDDLVNREVLQSVREVRREIEWSCPFPHIEAWVKDNRGIFATPTPDELAVVEQILREPRFHTLVKRDNILRGMPVADPFLIAAGKVRSAVVVTMEKSTTGGAKIPDVCKVLKVRCINLEKLFEELGIKY